MAIPTKLKPPKCKSCKKEVTWFSNEWDGHPVLYMGRDRKGYANCDHFCSYLCMSEWLMVEQDYIRIARFVLVGAIAFLLGWSLCLGLT